MKKLATFTAIMMLSSNSHAAKTQISPLIQHSNIKAHSTCFGFSYEAWQATMKNKYTKRLKSDEKVDKAMKRFVKWFPKSQFNEYKSNLACQHFTYSVDGLEVDGYVIKPKSHKGKLPVLIYNRGGNGSFGNMTLGPLVANLFPLADKGFVIIGSQYRQSKKPQVPLDEFGGADVNDVVALNELIPHIHGADSQRIGMYGASRGAMQSYLAVKKMPNIKALAAIAGVSDLTKQLERRPEMERVYKYRIPNYKDNKQQALSQRSVLHFANTLPKNIPILLLHSTDDRRVSHEQSVELAKAFALHNIEHKLVLYPDDYHNLRLNKKESFLELANWFNAHL
ncbi:hypothetical protein N473_13640 [Pseudoalteromonas luteoviolacea CPMOR-1]|uniref:Peptidase S9 prolyl oligopeptidase catalytic domain-containing protein n=1 Tax=Pseudoalteromonas luteoviolacea CPMOR-1 TaxID=1365248 RepID=A0A167LMA2_9GAMM|nr:prolyl oligopeptidase family serine peptidase [Pseudoalteromonas luteoviolacea]KZN64831.1 hypothetical protein N473_13640 [Pseudoalteromonas luteoviolacea CPMOR-1]